MAKQPSPDFVVCRISVPFLCAKGEVVALRFPGVEDLSRNE